jgi:environmental stress-induced protein Ves
MTDIPARRQSIDMHIIRAADCKVMPWKNGGGTTTEIALSPEGATLDDFDWRISMASVASDGPFSAFPGIDRTLAVLSGAGVVLAQADGTAVELEQSSEPHAFAGETAITSRLIDGPILDLNVMTRRGSWRHAMRRISGHGALRPATDGSLLVLVAAEPYSVRSADEAIVLEPGDSLVLRPGEALTIDEGAEGPLFAIDLWGPVT